MSGEGRGADSGHWLGGARERVGELCTTCVRSTAVDGGGVSMVSAEGVRDIVFTTDEIALAIEELQVSLGEGPCVDASANRVPVLVDQLTVKPSGAQQRWPFFIPEVDALGVRSLFAFPLRIGSVSLGTLELYRSTPGVLSTAHLNSALSTANGMAITLIDGVSAGDDDESGFESAEVHQAAGMVMVQLDVAIEEAFARLRATAFVEGKSLRGPSQDVVRGDRRFLKEQE